MRTKTIFSRDFILVAIGRAVSAFGNQILRYALPLYLLTQTGSAALFGSIMAVSFIPMLLLFPVGGIIADRMNKRNIMLVMDFCTAVLILLFCLLQGIVALIPLMTVTMILLYGIDGADKPTVKASIPALVNAEHIMRANSLVDMIDSTASMAGPVIGGLLLSVLGLAPILYVSIACFFASVVLDVFIRIPHQKRQSNGNVFATGFADIKESFGFMLKKQPVILKISVVFALSNLLLTSLVLIGLPVIVTQRLSLTQDTANRLYGYAQGAIAGGAVLGGFCAGALSTKLKAKTAPFLLIGCSLCIFGCGIALQMLSAPMAIYAVLVVCCGLLLTLHTIFQIQMVTILQLLTPSHLIGKVISCFICVVMCTNPLGQVIYGFVFEHIGNSVYLPFYITALMMIGTSLITRRTFSGIERSLS